MKKYVKPQIEVSEINDIIVISGNSIFDNITSLEDFYSENFNDSILDPSEF